MKGDFKIPEEALENIKEWQQRTFCGLERV